MSNAGTQIHSSRRLIRNSRQRRRFFQEATVQENRWTPTHVPRNRHLNDWPLDGAINGSRNTTPRNGASDHETQLATNLTHRARRNHAIVPPESLCLCLSSQRRRSSPADVSVIN